MAYALIDYGFGMAEFWGDFTEDSLQREFMGCANDCFGIRKSISKFEVKKFLAEQSLPEFWSKIEGAATLLKHSGDSILFDKDGEKIKSEWD